MPRKKSKKAVSLRSEKVTVAPADSYKSLLYGMLTVLVFFVLVFVGLKLIAHKTNPSIGESGISTKAQNLYVVQKGDTLWKIAQLKYNSGYKWVEIAKANNLSNPGSIETGMQLTIPQLSTPTPIQSGPTVAPTQTPTISQAPPEAEEYGAKIAGKSYDVVKGDYLWEIAERAYGDPYKWEIIAKANNLANPNIIHSGNKFIIPR